MIIITIIFTGLIENRLRYTPAVTAIYTRTIKINKKFGHWSFLGNRRLFRAAVKPVRPLDDGQYRWGIVIFSSLPPLPPPLPPPRWSADRFGTRCGHHWTQPVYTSNRFASPCRLLSNPVVRAYKVQQTLRVKYVIKLYARYTRMNTIILFQFYYVLRHKMY